MKKRSVAMKTRCGLVSLAAVLILTSANCAQTSAPSVAQTNEPVNTAATKPASQPIDLLTPAAAREPLINHEAIRQLKYIEDRLAPDTAEAVMFDSIKDYNNEEITTPLYSIFRKTSMAPEVDPKFFPAFDRPSLPSLVLDPKQYRLQPFRMFIVVYTCKMLTVQSGELTYNNAWPPDQPVWKLTAKNLNAYHMGYESLIIYTTKNPEEILGSPNNEEDGTRRYGENGRKLEILCTLYKILQAPNRDGTQTFDFPIVVAWQFAKPESLLGASSGGGDLGGGYGVLLGIIVLMLGAAFFIFLRFARQAKTRVSKFSEIKDAKKMYSGAEASNGEIEDGPVDPALKEAAEMFFKERGEDPDAKDRR